MVDPDCGDRNRASPCRPPPDRLFSDPASATADFRFDGRTASVFDDMVNRSVPFYSEMQRMSAELAGDFAVAGTNLVDLGCATGTTLLALDACIDPGVRFVGVDNAPDMLAKARQKLTGHGLGRSWDLVHADLHEDRVVQNASVVLMILTLQFVRPLYRQRVVRDIYAGLRPQGCVIVFEKVTLSDSLFNRLFIRYYYELKRRNGYSDSEIAHKREALENVLIPYRPDENRDLLLGAGFSHVEEFFRWYNFSGVIAVK